MICDAEGVRTDRASLVALAERTECDVRACLNTLQVRGDTRPLIHNAHGN